MNFNGIDKVAAAKAADNDVAANAADSIIDEVNKFKGNINFGNVEDLKPSRGNRSPPVPANKQIENEQEFSCYL